MSLHDYPTPSKSPDCYTDESIDQTVSEIISYMKKAGNEFYLADQEEAISQLSHSLQAGHQAKLYIQSNKLSDNQSDNQSNNQSNNQSIKQSNNQSNNQTNSQSNNQSINRCSDNELILAAFLHDLGHMILSRPDSWSPVSTDSDDSNDRPNYQEQHEYVGFAYLLQRGFSSDVADLVLGHVQAKRYLTSVEPDYLSKLSDASRMTLIGQGGPFTPDQAKLFEQSRNFEVKLLMRRWDEAAKLIDWPCDLNVLEEYGEKIRAHLEEQRDRSKLIHDHSNSNLN